MTSSPAMDAAATLIAELVGHGVRDIVVSPGSRSQALALAAVRAADDGHLRVHVRIDERVAGFTALGIARETRMPAAVVCTSGTAVGNLLPAVMEAFHSGVPMLLLTADRPRSCAASAPTRRRYRKASSVRGCVTRSMLPCRARATGPDSPNGRSPRRWGHARSRAASVASPGPCT